MLESGLVRCSTFVSMSNHFREQFAPRVRARPAVSASTGHGIPPKALSRLGRRQERMLLVGFSGH